jgi:hypothetical protein
VIIALLIIAITYWGGRTLNLIGEVKKQKQTIEEYRVLEEKQKKDLEKVLTEKQILEEQKQKLESEKKELEKRVQVKVRVASAVKPGAEQWRGLVAKHFPANQVDTALKVMACESGGNSSALNNNPRTGDYSVGLFQINLFGRLATSRPSEAWLKVPENNIQYASRMARNGWGAWSCYRKI